MDKKEQPASRILIRWTDGFGVDRWQDRLADAYAVVTIHGNSVTMDHKANSDGSAIFEIVLKTLRCMVNADNGREPTLDAIRVAMKELGEGVEFLTGTINPGQ